MRTATTRYVKISPKYFPGVTYMPNIMHGFESNSSSVPAFLIKLWKLVEDPSCNDLISWTDSGLSFIIRDQTRFSRDLLPQYFKHNNMASFIRQLNMYGFRKVMNYDKSGLRNESDEMEFQHNFFRKDKSSFLEYIKRNIPKTKAAGSTVKPDAKDILTDLTSIREKQETMDNMLLKMKQENELLWRELTSMRQKHKAQEQIIQKVIQFLVTIVQRSNQNLGVQRNMSRMLHDSPGNNAKPPVTGAIDVLRNKNQNFISVPQTKLVSPLGPVIHEVTDFEHEQDESHMSPTVKSPEERSDSNANASENEQEIECPLIYSRLNSPINTSATMEPLSILEPLQPSTPCLNTDDIAAEESVLGIPLDYIGASSPCDVVANVISIPEEPADNVISLPDTESDTGISYDMNPENVLVYTSSKSDYEDPLLGESLQTPKIPTIHIEDPIHIEDSIHIEDVCPSPTQAPASAPASADPEKNENEVDKQSIVSSQQSEHNYQLAVTDSLDIAPSVLTKEGKRCTNSISNSDLRFQASIPTLERRNTFSNYLLEVEEGLDWLQNQIASDTLTNIDAHKLLGLFSTDDVANNETLAGEIAAQTHVKSEPSDIVGNEVVQFTTPSMLEDALDIGRNQLLGCLDQDPEIAIKDSDEKNSEDQKHLLYVLNNADQEAASEAAEYLLSNESSKLKSPRRPKIQKLQKAKRRKIK